MDRLLLDVIVQLDLKQLVRAVDVGHVLALVDPDVGGVAFPVA